ncbi:MAG: class I SAM-dependent methyltransferase [Desulfobacca sp.]|nr:class I SAM-dependent methyltransferase [Desulfobacca sp.]
MEHRFDPSRKHVLDSPARHQYTRPQELLAWAGIAAGQTLLDFGCGTGFFTVPAARLVAPGGQVLATDIHPEMLAAVRAAVTAQGLDNVEIFPTPEAELSLSTPVDWVLLAFVLHEVSPPGQLLALAHKLIAPTGRILVVEWPREPASHGPPLKVRLSPEQILSLARPLGLVEVQRQEQPPHYYALVLKKS